jgi:hypothetical protein
MTGKNPRLFLNRLRETDMRAMNLLTAVMAAGLFAAPAFAQSSNESGGSAASTQIHCSPAKNADAAADPNCAQRVPPMPAQGSSGPQASNPMKSTGSQRQ